MIKPEEIHKGNLLMWEDDSKEIIKVTGFYEDEEKGDIVKFEGGVAQLDEFIPIPLTEEILIKAGFERKNGYGLRHSKISFIAIKVADAQGYHFKSTDINIEIATLHQLQNLFYSLTGTELKIQL